MAEAAERRAALGHHREEVKPHHAITHPKTTFWVRRPKKKQVATRGPQRRWGPPPSDRARRHHGPFMPQPKRREATQSHGQSSRVYVPILREIVRRKYTPGTQRIEFTKQDVEQVATDLGVKLGNAADVI